HPKYTGKSVFLPYFKHSSKSEPVEFLPFSAGSLYVVLILVRTVFKTHLVCSVLFILWESRYVVRVLIQSKTYFMEFQSARRKNLPVSSTRLFPRQALEALGFIQHTSF